MRFSIFELLAWITFLAALCAILFRGSGGEAMFGIAWITIAILALKFLGRRASLIASFAIAGLVSVHSALSIPLEAYPARNIPFLFALALNFFFFGSFAALIWGIVICVDVIIASLHRRVRRPIDD